MEPLSEQHIAQVRSDYIGYTSKHGLFDGPVSRQIGCSASVLSQFKNARYAGDNEAIARKINDWMERDARARRAEMPVEYVKTAVAEGMRAITMAAHSTGSMAVIVVPSGCGKTMVLQVLTEKLGGRYLYCDNLMTPRSFLLALAEACDVRLKATSASAIQRAIIEKLRGTARPLLLDEAHRLPLAVFGVIRSIYDQAEVAIVMAGTHEIIEKISDNSNSRGQLTSRCLRFNALDHLHDAENPDSTRRGKPLFSRKEIEALFAKSQVKFDRDAFEMVWALACLPGYGCIRLVRKLVQLVRQQHPEAEITRDLLTWGLGLLFGGVGNHMADVADRHCEQLRKTA